MKKQLSLIIVLFSIILLKAENTNSLEFYKSIPKFESIDLNVKDFKFQIKPNYVVNIMGECSSSGNKATLQGSGVVSWDASNNHMVINANFTISGTHTSSEDVYTNETVYNVGSVTNNTLAVVFGGKLESHTTTKRKYDHTEYHHASGSKSYNETWPLYINSDGTYYIGSNSTYSVILTGDVTRTVSFCLDSNVRNITYGSVRSGNNGVADEFGAWQWTNDKSHIYLYSINMQNNKFDLIRNNQDGTFMLQLHFNGSKIEGASESITNSGRLIQLNFSFEDGTSVSLPFLEQSGFVYTYATYNRFLEEWNMNATSLINQIKDKQMIIISYTNNGASYSEIFELEGLEAIMSYL